MILTVCMSPSVDVTIELDALNVGRTNVVKSKAVTLGGKALNVAVGARRLGCDVYATGLLYNENGYLFENMLNNEGIPHRFAWNNGRVRENYKFIDNRAMLTEVNDVGGAVIEGKMEEILALVKELSATSSVTVLSGGLPRGVEESYYGQLAKAVDARSKTIIDAVGLKMFSALGAGVELVKPNLHELEDVIGKSIDNKEDMLNGCYELIDRGAKRVLLSLGKKGAVITDGSKNFYCKSIHVAVNSTVGAGDGMVAAAAVGLEKGLSLKELLLTGVAAGTATVMSVGELSFTKDRFEDVYSTLTIKEI